MASGVPEEWHDKILHATLKFDGKEAHRCRSVTGRLRATTRVLRDHFDLG